MSATYETRGPVAVITLDNPPVNGLGWSTRHGIVDGIERAQADAAVKAIVLAGAGKAFSGGADIREFGSASSAASPDLLTVIATIEGSRKPVVAAMHAVAMGGGLELALGCHYRVVAVGAQVALPEVKLGLIPGAGGTQRLPRVLDLETAVHMMVSGDAVTSERLAALQGQKLFDKMVEGDVLAAAVEFAADIAERRPLPSVRDLTVMHPDAEACLQAARNDIAATSKRIPAPLKCLEAVSAAIDKPFDMGMKLEREIFGALMLTPESRALRHMFFAERAASKIPDVPADTPVRTIARVGVIGAGTMGAGIAMNFLNAGMPVTVLERTQDALDRGLATVRKNYEAQVKKGKLARDQLDQRLALWSGTLACGDLNEADLIIEAVFEDIDVKAQVFRSLDQVCKPGAILASNTSTLDLDKIAAFTKRPQDVVGMHFFSPANVMKLMEVVRGAKTAKDVLATVMALGKRLRKACVVSGVCDGFIGNRMLDPYGRQAGFLLEEGATPQQVDRAMEAFGFAMGPFRVGDLAGNDIGWYIRKRRYMERPDMRYSKIPDLLCEMGRHGQKTGAGWYDYMPGGRQALPSPVVAEMIDRHRTALGISPRRIGDEEIVQRLVYALVNEGARIVAEGIASRASDIDVVYLTGYGFPLHRGGPMCYADTQGLSNVVAAMKAFAANPIDDASFWEPAPLLAKLAAEGKTFN